MIEPENEQISIVRQCELVGLPRSSYYYKRKEVDEEEQELMRLIEEQYMKTPFYGARRMRAYLVREGYVVSVKMDGRGRFYDNISLPERMVLHVS